MNFIQIEGIDRMARLDVKHPVCNVKVVNFPHDKNIIVVKVLHQQKLVYQGAMPFENTFGGVAVGKPLAYLNSLMQLSFALNQGSMADKFNIGSGPDWTVEITWGDYLN